MSKRTATVAGMFYPADPDTLRADVARYLDEAEVTPAPERVVGVVAPHAGYMFSGPTAGHAFARTSGKKPERVVLLGRSHRYFFDGAAVYDSGAFETPLGAFPVDTAFAQEVTAEFGQGPVEAHHPEHSLEVQLPFLYEAVGIVPVVPVLFGANAAAWHMTFGRRLAEKLGHEDLVVASTDLSHYQPQERANAIDERTLQGVLSQDYEALAQAFARDEASMCGAPAVVAAMTYALAREATHWELLDYRTSAAASGDYQRVVGYGAISMERPAA
ncbi:MAG: AmmeMemoRadiSam system protein B [Candidatus Hydrogenedentota bacterium]